MKRLSAITIWTGLVSVIESNESRLNWSAPVRANDGSIKPKGQHMSVFDKMNSSVPVRVEVDGKVSDVRGGGLDEWLRVQQWLRDRYLADEYAGYRNGPMDFVSRVCLNPME